MAQVRIGGDPESYMEAPQISAGGGPGLIAMVLDALGIHKQVAKGPKNEAPKESAPQAAPKASESQAQAGPTMLPALMAAESAFQPLVPIESGWGKRFLESNKPLQSIDPTSAFK